MIRPLIFSFLLFLPDFASAEPGIQWEGFSDSVFSRAASEKKLVLLDLEAVWCHWCHVMDEDTYSKPDVQKLISSKYIAIRVDQDSRPDLANRYRDYGWPATIVLNGKGEDLAKRAGFIPPDELIPLLTKLSAKPEPEEALESTAKEFTSADGDSRIAEQLRSELIRRHTAAADSGIGGLKLPQKYLEADSLEYALLEAQRGDEFNKSYAALTLDSNIKLIDQKAGGVYQYSTHGDWDHPHFEKIVPVQAKNIRLYALGYQVLGKDEYKKQANLVVRYVRTSLQDGGGGFYTSQDADSEGGGPPRIDRHQYSRENGLLIAAFVHLYNATLDPKLIDDAKRSAGWALQKRALPGGGFRHDAEDPAGPYLSDSLAMGEAFLSLYGATAEREWLKHAEETAAFIQKTFYLKEGFLTSKLTVSAVLRPPRIIAENIQAARFFNLLSQYSGDKSQKASAESALRYLQYNGTALTYLTEPGVLIADEEFGSAPLHITVVGAKDDPAARALFTAGAQFPRTYKRLEWWDAQEGALENPDVGYPELPQAAAFVCTNRRCSAPILDSGSLGETIRALSSKKHGT